MKYVAELKNYLQGVLEDLEQYEEDDQLDFVRFGPSHRHNKNVILYYKGISINLNKPVINLDEESSRY